MYLSNWRVEIFSEDREIDPEILVQEQDKNIQVKDNRTNKYCHKKKQT